MKAKDIAKKVELLKEGQIVEIDNLLFSAKKIVKEEYESPCNYCNVDCICKGDIMEICAMLDFASQYCWYLNLESI